MHTFYSDVSFKITGVLRIYTLAKPLFIFQLCNWDQLCIKNPNGQRILCPQMEADPLI
jgi:hypothetical protein